MKSGIKIKKRWIVLGVVVLIGGYLAYQINQLSKIKPTLMATSATYQELNSYLSTTGSVTTGDLDEYILSGTTSISTVNFKVGDTVRAGDVIAVVDNSDIQDNYKMAAISYEKIRLNLEEIERNYFDIKEDIRLAQEDIDFYKKKMDEYEDYSDPDSLAKYAQYEAKWEGFKTKKETLEKTLPSDEAIKITQLTYEEAKMAMDQAQKLLDEAPSNIVARNSGIIETLSVQRYNTALKGQMACTIRTTETTTIDFRLGRYDVNKVTVGMPATVTISSVKYEGYISEIDTVATMDGYVKAKIQLEDPGTLIPGLDADIEVLTYSSESVLALPIEVVKTDKNGDYVYVLEPIPGDEEGLYQPVRTYITTGNTSTQFIEVTGGMEDGQLVVSNPPSYIDAISAVNVLFV